MSGAKPLRRIFPKNVSGVVQDPSDQCKILWDDRVGSPTFHKISRFKISVPIACVTLCYAKTVRGVTRSCRSCLCCNCRGKIDVHVPCLATWNDASTMRHTRGNHDHFKSTQATHATQNNENILAAGMHNQCKAAQLNHIDRCDRTLHTLPVFPSPRPRSLEKRNGTDDGRQLANQMRKVVNISRCLTNF